MSTIYPVPEKNDVHQILNMLYGDDMKLDESSDGPSDNIDKIIVASYINDEGEPVTSCVCDHSFAAFASSALTRIPPGGAEDAANTGDFSKMMLENLYEIMNICSRLFMQKSNTPHIKLDVLYSDPADMPGNVKDIVENSNVRADFNVSIPGYGDGTLSFLCT
jgi:hypothetical protein